MLLQASRIAKLQETMLRIRLLEDRLQEICDAGQGSDLHFSKGQEAISTGVIAALRETDYIVTHHRTIAHAVARGVPLRPLVAELLGKAEGLNGGMAGEMHLSSPEHRFLFSFQLVGTCVSVAAGAAWAVKHHMKSDDIVVVFHGDAATGNAQWHEGLNIAAVNRLPLFLVCENNHVAGNVRQEKYLPVERVAQRAAAYGIESACVDGNDVEAVFEAAQRSIEWVRSESIPFLLDCDTTRLGKHKQGQGDLRTKEELALLALRDPLKAALFDPGHVKALQDEIESIIREVQAGPDPMFPKEDT